MAAEWGGREVLNSARTEGTKSDPEESNLADPKVHELSTRSAHFCTFLPSLNFSQVHRADPVQGSAPPGDVRQVEPVQGPVLPGDVPQLEEKSRST